MLLTVVSALLMMNIGAGTIQSCLFLPNLMLEGGTYDEFTTMEIRDCCVACSSHECCIAYTYDEITHRCYLKSAIGSSEEDSTKTSGLKPNAYFAKGVKLKNILIDGDQSNTLELKNHEECRAYCSAYQVCSWRPHRNQGANPKGECACSMRIKSLKYMHGCVSEILPTSQ
ncbi:unnamed protein product [Caenorhabditis bovis]|uniref:Apple domain-containing protein n=1 Tax=Caenorhabditis bovis TaxID=2654633 RepID=A0A8S1EJ97_9PELO|nr:unnamed protein product [Caenorhabditis bovis]